MSRFNFIESKVVSLHQAIQFAEKKRLKNQKVVFTNGCFDILHLGHVRYLAEAASLGDCLFVAVNDDASVRSLGKGKNRPVNPELARALVLSALGFVDYVVVFSEPTPIEAILCIKPDLIVKGGDYNASITDPKDPRYIVGCNEAKDWGEKHSPFLWWKGTLPPLFFLVKISFFLCLKKRDKTKKQVKIVKQILHRDGHNSPPRKFTCTIPHNWEFSCRAC